MIFLALIAASLLISVFFLFFRKLTQNPSNKSRNNSKKINEKSKKISDSPRSFAFFHPNCSAGGGGERTLFSAIKSIRQKYPKADLIICINAKSRNQKSLAEIQRKALTDFNILIPNDIKLVRLNLVHLAESHTWTRFTLIGQVFGSMLLALEAAIKIKADVLIDTSGFPFIYPVFKMICRSKIVAYVHYPFISFDMLERVGTKSFNNSSLIARHDILVSAKRIYYRTLIGLYSFCGSFCDLAMTNSTWTNRHMIELWKNCRRIRILYPPCALNDFINSKKGKEEIQVLSLAQFRPEKNHQIQLEIAVKVLEKNETIKFIFVGGCRDAADEERVQVLKIYAKELGIPDDSIRFKLNLPFEELEETLKAASIGLHTMIDEHFGIGIVELMAAGLITIANNSGGPKSDIIKNSSTGFLCSTIDEYAETILKIVSMPETERMKIAEKASADAINRFSEDGFIKRFAELINI